MKTKGRVSTKEEKASTLGAGEVDQRDEYNEVNNAINGVVG